MITRLLDAIEHASRWPTLRPMRLRWQIVTLVLILALLGAAARAGADELKVTQIHYLRGSGTIAATVASKGPPNSALAIDLYRNRCPARPAETDVDPGVSADGQPQLLLANPPQPGEGGRFELCAWTIHEDGAIGARYSRTVTLPAPKTPSWDPVAGTSHSWLWPLLGWPALLLFAIPVVFVLSILVPAELIRRFLRRVKRHFRRSRETEPRDGEDGETLDELRHTAAAAAAAGVAGADNRTLRYDTLPYASRPQGQPGTYPLREPATGRTPGRTSTTGGHPFTPPSPPAPEEPATEEFDAADDVSGAEPDASDGGA